MCEVNAVSFRNTQFRSSLELGDIWEGNKDLTYFRNWAEYLVTAMNVVK